MTRKDRILRLRIELDDWHPPIWRRVEVPDTATLKALHDVVQAVIPFEGYHLFEFRAGDERYALPMPGGDGFERTLSARSTKLGTLVGRGVREFGYTYDFGDNWRFTLTVEADEDAEPGLSYPRFLDGENRGPPEDVGGLPGFEFFIDAIEDPEHEEHAERLEWYGGPFDASVLPREEIERRIGRLARRRAAGRAAFEKSRKTA